MESVHCFHCYRFPSKSLDFYISNCMHVFCVDCKQSCQPDILVPAQCILCHIKPIRLLKMGPTMPETVKSMFTPISEDLKKFETEVTRVYTFQYRQRHHLISGLTKKENAFDKLRDAYQFEKKKKENYKDQLDNMTRLLQAKELEISELRLANIRFQQAPPPSSTQTPPTFAEKSATPSMIRVFTDSMYQGKDSEAHSEDVGILGMRKTKNVEAAQRKIMDIPPFRKHKSMTCQPSSKQASRAPPSAPFSDDSNFQTPRVAAVKKDLKGFTTPANPPHMFPFIKKFEMQAKTTARAPKIDNRSSQHSQ
ncbi:hypothetical protein L3Y34_009919 [Caenorhabditis briggsae]|uniref:Uncharacterized protein n=1 Tax=Caenorhabditis briggsae TaxID=6238 RepID=A0AAE9AB62_CAEBR|nr:hypothetical protein L3Y34_009919 [Caenorhabditis briggsae]